MNERRNIGYNNINGRVIILWQKISNINNISSNNVRTFADL